MLFYFSVFKQTKLHFQFMLKHVACVVLFRFSNFVFEETKVKLLIVVAYDLSI